MIRTHSLLLTISAAFVACFAAACSSQPTQPAAPPDTRAADETAIRAASDVWNQAAAAKDLDKSVSVYTDDAVLFAPKAPAAMGKDAIRKGWQGLLAAPGLQLTVTTTGVDVARSGDLAVERGTFSVVTTDKKGKPNTETGQLVVVWKKQADGSWKVVADTNADDK